MGMREEFVTFPTPGENLPFIIELAGISYCDGSYKIHRAKSKCMVTEYIIAGEGTVILDEKKYTAREGDIYLLPAGHEQLYYSDAKNPWTKIWFNARGPLIDELLHIYNTRNIPVFSQSGGKEYLTTILDIGRENAYCVKEKHEKAAIVFHQLLQYLYGIFYARKEEYSEETKILKEYIANHITEDISLKDLSSLVYLSESQIIRVFKQDMGKTPYEYILELKIGQAKLLLRSTRLMIKEIAFRLGFCDEHYFSYLFKQKTGQTPSAYRKSSSVG